MINFIINVSFCLLKPLNHFHIFLNLFEIGYNYPKEFVETFIRYLLCMNYFLRIIKRPK